MKRNTQPCALSPAIIGGARRFAIPPEPTLSELVQAFSRVGSVKRSHTSSGGWGDSGRPAGRRQGPRLAPIPLPIFWLVVARAHANVVALLKAAPVLTRNLDETMRVAGARLDHAHTEWIRLHPVPFRDLAVEERFAKYQEFEVDLIQPFERMARMRSRPASP